jgi:lysophospholipase L1-like esterase
MRTRDNTTPRLRLAAALVAAFTVLALVLLPLEARSAPVYPGSMAALGDSITRGVGTGFWLLDAPANSWSTGTTSTVNSHYLRIRAVNSAINGKNSNLAKTGAKMSDLSRQAGLVGSQTEYVTILIGANDVCTSSESSMTAVQTFRDQFTAAMNTLTTRAPNARVYVVSIPDVQKLWSLFKNNSTARSKWSQYSVCKSMLANPTSTAQTDVDRRARVRQRNIDFNAALEAVCATFSQCRFDGNRVFNYQFIASDVSTVDYFHPSRSGQATLSRETWNQAIFEP